MIKIGITGQQGSGKSFITNEFSKLGVPTIMMDDIAKSVQYNNNELIKKLVDRFPDGYPNGILDKFRMREILFKDKTGKNAKDISEIISPYINQEIDKFYIKNSKSKYVIVESALLFEYNLQNKFDLIIFVNSDPKTRKEKAIYRDNISEEDYDNRMRNQLSDEYKLENSDYIITNDYTNNVIGEVFKLNETILKLG